RAGIRTENGAGIEAARQKGKIGDTADIEHDAVLSFPAEDEIIAVYRQGCPFSAGSHVFLPEIAQGNDTGANGQVITIADLEGSIIELIIRVKEFGGMVYALAMTGHDIYFFGTDLPFFQAAEYHGGMLAGYPAVEQAYFFEVN